METSLLPHKVTSLECYYLITHVRNCVMGATPMFRFAKEERDGCFTLIIVPPWMHHSPCQTGLRVQSPADNIVKIVQRRLVHYATQLI